jgi:PncC family amidohydrolase
MTTQPADLVAALEEAGCTLATAESLTGGQVAAALTGVPGSSKVYGGGVVSYATSVKIDLLGIPEELVAEHGVVSEECAAAMAESVRELLGADVGLSTTGVAGPDRQEDKPVGTVFIGVASDRGTTVVPLSLSGDRVSIQQQVVDAAMAAGVDHLG